MVRATLIGLISWWSRKLRLQWDCVISGLKENDLIKYNHNGISTVIYDSKYQLMALLQHCETREKILMSALHGLKNIFSVSLYKIRPLNTIFKKAPPPGETKAISDRSLTDEVSIICPHSLVLTYYFNAIPNSRKKSLFYQHIIKYIKKNKCNKIIFKHTERLAHRSRVKIPQAAESIQTARQMFTTSILNWLYIPKSIFSFIVTLQSNYQCSSHG